jgi:type II secretory pathway component PulF
MSYRPSLSVQIKVFRTLAAFMSSGIPILRGLHCLAESPETRQIGTHLHGQLLSGKSLSQACAGLPREVVQLLAGAERSGQLHALLPLLADHLEEGQRRQQQLKAALIYPCMVLSLALMGALALPHLLPLQHYQPLPLLTRIVLLLTHPLLWLGLAALAWSLRHRLPRPQLPQPLRSAHFEVQLATSLGMQLRAGVPILSALSLSLPEHPQVGQRLRNGETLSQALQSVDLLRPGFRGMIAAGEESGRLAAVLQWVAANSKLEYEQSLETMIKVLEPLLLGLVSLVVAVVLLATLLPSLRLLDSL